MKLPADITENEMKIILKEIRIEYAPGESYDFISQLGLEQLKELFDLIDTKDPIQQEKKWSTIKDKLKFARTSINMLIQKIQVTKIKLDEKINQDDDNGSIKNLENQF